MAIMLKNSADMSTLKVNLLGYGQSGAGKTYAIRTLPNPVVLSAEGGLLSISDVQIPFIEIKSMSELMEAYQWLTQSEEAKQFDSVAIDSISEIGEVCLSTEKKGAKDKRMAYGEMADQISEIIRNFRDIPGKHVYMTAKLEQAKDELGRLLYYPSMPGNKTTQGLPYFFDQCLAFRVEKDQDNNEQRMIQTRSDGLWQAKDRGGRLDPWEYPDLGNIINKIKGVKQ